MTLSSNAIQDLRTALRKSYGEDFDIAFSDEDISEIGELFLHSLAENLKMKVLNIGRTPQL